MKKKILLLGLLFFAPLLGFGLEKSVPDGYIYFGILPQKSKINALLQKIITAEKYPALKQSMSQSSQDTFGLNILQDSPSKIGVCNDRFIEFFFRPKTNSMIIRIPASNPAKFLDKFKAILKRKWIKVKEKNADGMKVLTPSNLRYVSNRVFYQISGSSILLSPSAQDIKLLEKAPSTAMNEALFTASERKMESEKPLFFFYLSRQNLIDFAPQFAQFARSVMMMANSSSQNLSLDFLTERKDDPDSFTTPRFLENNPLLLISFYINHNEISQLIQKTGDLKFQMIFDSLDLQNTLGNSFFIALQDFNYIEVLQGILDNIQGVMGLEVKNSQPYASLLEMMFQQQAVEQSGSRFKKIPYRGNLIYAFEGLPIQTSIQTLNLYTVVLKDFFLIAMNEGSLRKTIDNYLDGKKEIVLPVEPRNTTFFMDLERFFQKVPMITPILQRYGIAIDNFRYLLGKYQALGQALQVNLSLFFSR